MINAIDLTQRLAIPAYPITDNAEYVDNQARWVNDTPVMLHFRKTGSPGCVEMFMNGTWHLVAAIQIVNMVHALCPFESPKPPPTGPRGLMR